MGQDNMLTICTRWETSQMSSALEWRIWRQLRGAFNINRFVFVGIEPDMTNVAIEQFDNMRDALNSCHGQRIFLEPTGRFSLDYLQGSKHADMVFILGNTEHNNLQFVQQNDVVLRIDTPGMTDLYGINAAAIALAYRYI